jgi:hypothetical protein
MLLACAAIPPVRRPPEHHSALARWGVRLALLAVLGSLLAPLARLSAEVATGQLGGLCLASAVYGLNAEAANPGTPDSAPATAGLDSCQGCASSLMTPPPTATTVEVPAARLLVAAAFAKRLAERPAFERPPGRAPPAFV